MLFSPFCALFYHFCNISCHITSSQWSISLLEALHTIPFEHLPFKACQPCVAPSSSNLTFHIRAFSLLLSRSSVSGGVTAKMQLAVRVSMPRWLATSKLHARCECVPMHVQRGLIMQANEGPLREVFKVARRWAWNTPPDALLESVRPRQGCLCISCEMSCCRD